MTATLERPTHWQDTGGRKTVRRKLYYDDNGVPRDQWGRPVITRPDGTQAGYTRVSGLAKLLGSQDGLMKWKSAMTALGVAQETGLLRRLEEMLGDPNPYETFKRELYALAEKAQEAAGATAKRETGTEIHHWSEVVDHGGDLSGVPENLRADVDAYMWATEELEVLETEQFVVNDEACAAGTLDRLVRQMWNNWIVVGDLKTGQHDCNYPMSVEMQVATYARGHRYDFATGERTPLHPDIDIHHGLLIHAPSGKARCDLYALDLDRGWANVQFALQLKKIRAGEQPLTALIPGSEA